MTLTPTVYRAAWVIPVTAPPVPLGAVSIDGGGQIVEVGPADEVSTAGAVVDLGDCALLPGMVNVHAHPELSMLRGRLEGLAFPDWIERLVELKYERLRSTDLRASTWLGVAEAIAAGVTCLAAPDDAGFLLEAMVETGLRGCVYREVFGPEPERADTAVRRLAQRVEAMRRLQNDLVEVGISPHAPYTVSRPLLSAVADLASAERLPLCVHAAESEAEEIFIRDGRGPFADRLRRRGVEPEATGESPIAWLAATGVLAARPLLVHCVRVNRADVDRIADAGAAIAHCPVSNAKFGHGVAPLLDFLEAGIPVGLGSDSVASNNRVDLLAEARFATLLQRSTQRRAELLSPPDLLRLVTFGGATALGLEDRIGSLEPGKDADLVAVGLSGPHVVPVSDPAAVLFHSASASDVRLTMVRGRVLYRDGEFTTLDWRGVADEVGRALASERGE